MANIPQEFIEAEKKAEYMGVLPRKYKKPLEREKEMREDGRFCFAPAVPFWDTCMNRGGNVKRFDCGECVEKHGLWDSIE